jgi:hypothetical protein
MRFMDLNPLLFVFGWFSQSSPASEKAGRSLGKGVVWVNVLSTCIAVKAWLQRNEFPVNSLGGKPRKPDRLPIHWAFAFSEFDESWSGAILTQRGAI